ncbi:hypothetical protein UPYG_G00107970 [Umbra pygmaea]|uniref:Uncharacterized protein n=1 Tax=Umbra pygmaea TaxID=75934 RepID=A0ABD0XHX2_UMBPY
MQSPNIMSLISLVDESIKLCEVEEARINKNIIQCREILRALKPQQENNKESQLADVEIDPDILPEERQEMELVNKLLEKALRVRGVTAPYKDPSSFTGPKKEPVDTTQNKESTLVLDCIKGNKTGIKSTSKSIALDIKESTKCSASHSIRGGRGKMHLQMPTSGKGRASMIRGSVHTQKPFVMSSKRLPSQSSLKEGKRTGPLCPLSHEGPIPQGFSSGPQCVVSHRSLFGEDSGKYSPELFQPPHGEDPVAIVSEAMGKVHGASAPLNSMLSKWSSLRNKQNRLWDKVLAQQSKPFAGKSHFTERVRSTFAKDWPACGSQCDTSVQVDRLTLLCKNLTHRCWSERLQSRQTSKATDREPGTDNDEDYESLLMLEGQEKMVADLRKCAAQLIKEWEAWDRWRSPQGGGAFCCIRKRVEWDDPSGVTLMPQTLTYASQEELQEVERLRMRVELLQQEVHLQQAFSDNMDLLSTPGPHSPSVLRDIYSLLAEGGVQFPALVLDTETG